MEKIIKTKNFFRRTFLHCSRSRGVFFFAFFIGFFLLTPNIHPAAAFDIVKDWINPALYAIFEVFGYLSSVASGIFVYAADAAVFNQIMDGEAIYAVWKIIRDFCNIFFIVILLFSAFATIFQLDKYDYKKTIPTLILMAILVNFSFPIARFIIDLANVIMYFFLQNVFQVNSASDVSSGLLGGSNLSEILIPKEQGQDPTSMDTTKLIFAIICIFLFAITLLVLAVLMVVRMVGLAILVMLSPVGFVGMITPALHQYAHEWWSKLFKWAFFGPTSVIFLLIAIRFMQASKGVLTAGSVTGIGSTGGSTLAAIAYFAIPIVLMWMAILQGEKAASDISGTSIKFGSNIGRKVGGWVKKGATTVAMSPYTGIKAGVRQTGIPGGIKQAWQDRFVTGPKEARERRERSRAAQWGGERARTRLDQDNKRLTDEAAKKMNMADLGVDELREIVEKNKSEHTKAAALTEIAGRGLAEKKDLNKIRGLFTPDSQVVRTFESKMRAFDPVAVFTDKNGDLNKARLENFVKSNQFDAKKLSDNSLKNADLMRYAFDAKNISTKDLDELRSKGSKYAQAIDDTLSKTIDAMNTENGGTWNMSDDIQRNIQSAYLAQTGKLHASMDTGSSFEKTKDDGTKERVTREAAKSTLLSRTDASTLKRMKRTFVDTSTTEGRENMNILTDVMPAGKVSDLLFEMEKSGAEQEAIAAELAQHIKTIAASSSATEQQKRMYNKLRTDPRTSHLVA